MDTQPGRRTRVVALDGLRGLTIVLVVLGHSWIVYPHEAIDRVPGLRAFFQGGAVTVFFVVGGYIVTQSLLREREQGRLDPLRFYLRRIVRIGVQLVPMAIAVLLITRFDPTDTTTLRTTLRSLVSTLTFTWNTYLIDNALEARPDLGHLWYLSVQQQVYLVLPLVILVLGRWRAALAAALTGAAALVVAHRFQVLGTPDGEWVASLSTTTRADGLLLGAAAAALATRLPHRPVFSARIGTLCLIGLGGLMLVLPELPDDQYLREWGVAFILLATALVYVMVQQPDRKSAAATFLSHPWLVWLGNASLAIYVWHFPVLWTVSRHTTGWPNASRAALALALLAGITVVAKRFIEEPTQRWLRDSPRWGGSNLANESTESVTGRHRAAQQ